MFFLLDTPYMVNFFQPNSLLGVVENMSTPKSLISKSQIFEPMNQHRIGTIPEITSGVSQGRRGDAKKNMGGTDREGIMS